MRLMGVANEIKYKFLLKAWYTKGKKPRTLKAKKLYWFALVRIIEPLLNDLL
jgi:hypothetical protein